MSGYREDPLDAEPPSDTLAVARTRVLLGAFGRGEYGSELDLPASTVHNVTTTLDALYAERATTEHLSTRDLPALELQRSPARSMSRALALTIIGAAAAVILAVALVAQWPSHSPQAPVVASASADPQLSATLMSAIGRHDGPFTSARVARCMAANNIAVGSGHAAVLGSSTIRLDNRDVVAVLLTTGQVGKFRAVVVGTDCDSGTPSLLRDTVVGN